VIAVPDILISERKKRVIEERSEYNPLSRVDVPDNSVLVGTSPDLNDPQKISEYSKGLSITPQIVNLFLNTDKVSKRDTFNNLKTVQELGYIPMLSLGFKDWDLSTQGEDLGVLLAGLFDIDGPILIRPGFEVNSPWAKKWYGNPSTEQYIESWISLHELIDFFGINAKFVYSPNSSALESVSSVSDYYPGSKYVDIVSLDTYNKKSIYRTDPRYYAYDYYTQQIEMGKDISDLQDIAFDKPLIITELNASVESFRGGWIAKSIDYAVHHGAVGIVTFDWDKKGDAWDEIDWRVYADRQAAKAVSKEFEKPHFNRNPINAEQNLQLILSQPQMALVA
jgi:hypothetical protein